MTRQIVLEEQKGLWIEEGLLQQAQLGERLQVVVKPGEIQILPMMTVPTFFPYKIGADEARTALQEVCEEVVALYGGHPPPADQPYFGGLTWREYQALSDKERQALWDRLYAEFDVAIEAVEERDVQPGALTAG
jgi:hypothetical protein